MAGSSWRWIARTFAIIAWLLLLAPAASPASGPSNDDCLACHSDKTLTTKRGSRSVSLFVDGKKFSSSVHNALSCTSCHATLEGKDLPHESPVARVECLAPHCVDCHGNHDIVPVHDPRSAVAPLKVP